MHKSYKKTIAILVTSLLIGALFILPASAVNVGGATIEVIGGSFWRPGYGEDKYNRVNSSNGSDEGWDARIQWTNPEFSTGNIWESTGYFVFSSDHTYGTLSVTVISTGAVQSDSATGFYTVDDYGDNRSKLDTQNTFSYEKNSVVITYTGYIPSRFNIVNYSYYFPQTGYLTTDYYYFTFTPIDKGSQDIINNQNDNTDKIIQNQEQLQENEKNEAQGSGNSAADDVTSVMPNKSEGFMNAMQSFVGAMSTTNTDCKIKFPGIKVPALEGFFPDTDLLSEQEVDISQAINLIPSAIMSLIQAITTVGLIVYCFKELYDTISEALTRRQQNE